MATAKFSKNMLRRGLERFESVEAVALWLGVHRTTVWRKMRAWNLDMQQAKAQFAAREEAAAQRQAASAQVNEPAKVMPKAERNILRFNMSDYTGSNQGDVRPSSATPNTILTRYHKLRGC